MIKNYSITVNGNIYEVEVEELGNYVATEPKVTASKMAPKQQVSKTQTQPKSTSDNVVGSSNIKAPMPGTISDVRVQVGDKVKKGQVLLILEAMKMENEIYAGFDGTVSSINVSKGASVSVGDVLVTFN